jgi:hypothetical protein
LEQRLTRTITARVQDDQYDWLVERAVDEEGDLSKALRDAIDGARVLERILAAANPLLELEALLQRSDRDAALDEREARE